MVTGRVHLYYIRSSLWCRIVRRRGGNKKWLRHGRLMQAKTRIQWPSRRINLRNNAQDRYLWLWRVTLLSMIWMWCLGPYFTTILCISTTCYSTKKPTFYCTKYFFIQVLSSENKLYDEVKSLNHKINLHFECFAQLFTILAFCRCVSYSADKIYWDPIRFKQLQNNRLSSWVVDLGSNLNS